MRLHSFTSVLQWCLDISLAATYLHCSANETPWDYIAFNVYFNVYFHTSDLLSLKHYTCAPSIYNNYNNSLGVLDSAVPNKS